MKVTAIFDIGKTNKKFFLFDEDYREVYRAYSTFEEIADDDGYPADDLDRLVAWMKAALDEALDRAEFSIQAVNCSSYGASLVHIDRQGRPVTPLYNYTKPYPDEVLQSFYQKYGDADAWACATASPVLGMLNSGLQLYWLKHTKPGLFSRIRYALHLPQYLSYVFTGVPVSDYTSIGCHTGLWDYTRNDYHEWVYAEELHHLLPPTVPTATSINCIYNGRRLSFGVGIHDSSSALLPYLLSERKPFLLLSTGTWSIALNPFSEDPLTPEELRHDCLNYLRIDGKPVKAARLFLGHEYRLQTQALAAHYGQAHGYHRQIRFDENLYSRLKENFRRYFYFESLPAREGQPERSQLEALPTFEEAYHQLMLELMELQVPAVYRALGKTAVDRIYLDGGFADNDLYVKLLAHEFKAYALRITQSPLGSALGAALVLSDKQPKRKFLKKQYALKKQAPLTLMP